jgi:hypothetical protein
VRSCAPSVAVASDGARRRLSAAAYPPQRALGCARRAEAAHGANTPRERSPPRKYARRGVRLLGVTIFGPDWDDVGIEDVEAFLADAGDEGLTWEAKGTERPHVGSIARHVSAFANSIGGFYIIGASRERRDGPWRIDPVDFRGDEPTTWLSNVIRNGVRPIPPYDVKAWTRNGGTVAVVRVDLVAEPPCMTRSGEVFTRVSGESPKVTDPTTLRRLFERGEARAFAAEDEAIRAATLPDTEGELVDGSFLRIRLAFAPTGLVDDVAGRLFTRTFYDVLADRLDRLPAAPLFPYPGVYAFLVTARQDALVARETHEENRQRWSAVARWDGSVALYLDVIPESEDIARLTASEIFGAAVRPAAEAAEALVRALGGYGRAHVALRFYARSFSVVSGGGLVGRIPGPATLLPIQAWTDTDGTLGVDQYARMRRELLRASGLVVWEPTEDEAAGE